MILVVDDDVHVADAVRTALESEGYEVKTAGNGGEAYELVKLPSCKCMLLDMNMPEVNGAELLLLMQADDIQVETIVMAAFTDYEETELQQFSNVKRLLRKPFEMDELLEDVKACLARHK